MLIDFRSDNTHGASPEVLDALQRAAAGTMTSYGGDAITARVRDRCCDLFGRRRHPRAASSTRSRSIMTAIGGENVSTTLAQRWRT